MLLEQQVLLVLGIHVEQPMTQNKVHPSVSGERGQAEAVYCWQSTFSRPQPLPEG